MLAKNYYNLTSAVLPHGYSIYSIPVHKNLGQKMKNYPNQNFLDRPELTIDI